MLIEEIVGEPISEGLRKSIQSAGMAASLSAAAMGGMAADEIYHRFSNNPTTVTVEVPPADDADTAENRRLLALTIWGEARSGGAPAMRAVGHVVLNRVHSGLTRRFGRGIKGVVWHPKQFSCWNSKDPNRAAMHHIAGLPKHHPDRRAWKLAKKLAGEILSGHDRDPTSGALFYHTGKVDPSWNADMKATGKIGGHQFYKGDDEVLAAAQRKRERSLS